MSTPTGAWEGSLISRSSPLLTLSPKEGGAGVSLLSLICISLQLAVEDFIPLPAPVWLVSDPRPRRLEDLMAQEGRWAGPGCNRRGCGPSRLVPRKLDCRSLAEGHFLPHSFLPPAPLGAWGVRGGQWGAPDPFPRLHRLDRAALPASPLGVTCCREG